MKISIFLHAPLNIMSNSDHERRALEIRENRAALHFEPPDPARLYETYQRPRARYYDSTLKNDHDELCSTCAGLPFLALLQNGLQHEYQEGIQIKAGIPIGYSDAIYAHASCPFCRLLVELGDTNMLGDGRDVEFWSLTTIGGHQVFSETAENLDERETDGKLQREPKEQHFLLLVRSIKPPPGYGYLYRTIFKDNSFIGLKSLNGIAEIKTFSPRPAVDGEEILRKIALWLRQCDGHRSCQPRLSNYPHHDGFCLFDTNTLRTVVAPLHTPYLCFSYCWDQIEHFPYRQDLPYTLDVLPGVFRDLIKVARFLSFRYIWIDRLCIDDGNKYHKQANIYAMGQIYQVASATIMLTVPSQNRAEAGLPGLSVPRQGRVILQRVESFSGLTLCTTLPSMEMALLTSWMNRRAWTFQEGIMSNRAIVFGPEQVYFECTEMVCYESIQEPASTSAHKRLIVPSASRLRNPFLAPYDFYPLYWRLVRDYTARDLKFSFDSLNAFSAFSSEFDRSPATKLHWGLPLADLTRSLLWEHEPWDFRNICRRSEFPSWTWAGWAGTAAMNYPLNDDTNTLWPCITSVTDEDEKRTLTCTARSAQVTLAAGLLVSVLGDCKSSFVLDCGMNMMGSYHSKTCDMLEICRNKDSVQGLLLQARQGDDVFERIGSGFMSLSLFEAKSGEVRTLRLG